MNKLTRKQCNAIIKTRASMLSVKTNHKKSNESNLVCKFWSETEETQEHTLQTCQKVGIRVTKIKYEDVFKEEASKLKEVSEEIIRVENLLKNPSKQHELLAHEWATPAIWAYALQQQHKLRAHGDPSIIICIFDETWFEDRTEKSVLENLNQSLLIEVCNFCLKCLHSSGYFCGNSPSISTTK